MTRHWLRYGAAALAVSLLATGCGGEDSPPDPADGAPAAAPTAADPPPGSDAEQSDGSPQVPDEQVLCGAVEEAPIVRLFGEEITQRVFHPPSGSGTNISCNWETVTKSFTVKFYFWPDFRTLIDDDIFEEYGEGEFEGLGVEAHRTVWRGGIIFAGPHGTAIELTSAGPVTPSDEDNIAIGRAAQTAAETTYG